MLVARSKTDFVFIFFILGTFLVLKGGWGTPKVGLVEYSIRKLIGRCVGNLGNIACTSNPNNGQGHQNAQGLAAMRNWVVRQKDPTDELALGPNSGCVQPTNLVYL